MKYILNLIVSSSFSQKFESKDWIAFPVDELSTLKFTKSETIKYQDFLFCRLPQK